MINSVCLYWYQFSPHLELGANSQASPGQDASAEAQRFIISIIRMCRGWTLKCPELLPAHMHWKTLQSGTGFIPRTHSPLEGQEGSVSEQAQWHRSKNSLLWATSCKTGTDVGSHTALQVSQGPVERRAMNTYISQPGTPGRPCAVLGGWGKADSCCPSGNQRC